MKNYQTKNITPATVWQDTTPVGNGKISALVYGNVFLEKILLNHEGWWYKESSPNLPNFGDCLAKCRKLMDEGRYSEAEKVFPDEMAKHTPYAAASLYQPGIDLRIESQLKGEYQNYSRKLDMSTGEATVEYSDEESFVRSTFVSRADDVVVVRIKGESKWSGKIWLEPHEIKKAVGIFGEPFKHGLTFSSEEKEGIVSFYGKRNDVPLEENNKFAIIGVGDREKNFGAKMKVVAVNGVLDFLSNSSGNGSSIENGVVVDVKEANEVLILVSLYQGKDDDSVNKVFTNNRITYKELFDRHSEIHKNLFKRTMIDFAKETDLSNEELLLKAKHDKPTLELINKLWYFGRYLFIISTKENCLPANLTGVWNGDYFAPWRGVFFINENTEIIYWQAYSGNMPELLLPLFDFFEKQIDDYRENAQKMFQCRGIRIPIYVDPYSGHEKDYSPHALYWVGGALWIASMFYDYYDFTLDEKFLINRAYPFMKETALFFEDYLVEKDGKLHCYPATSPENCANGKYEKAGQLNISIDTTMDISIIKDIFNKLISVAKKYNIDKDKIDKWQEIVNKLPKYRINSDGALAEWINTDFEDNYRHRHLSHLFPVFPGTEINDKSEFYFPSKKALEMRMSQGIKEMTGWALAHTSNVYAHLKESNGVSKCINLIARHFTGKNLFGYHNNNEAMGVGLQGNWCNHSPHQLDVSSGLTSAIQEAVCYFNGNVLEILPAFLDISKDISVYGIALRNNGLLRYLRLENDKLEFCLNFTNDISITISFPKDITNCQINNEILSKTNNIDVNVLANKDVKVFCEFKN